MRSRKKSLLMTAIGMGVTYLMNNKQARDRLVGAVKSIVSSKSKSRVR
ncbi:hypothetical protein [Gorillibacterium sp. CAU 1737]